MTDARQAAGEPTPQDPAALYARPSLRGMKFSHFSASRNDTRAQFRRWSSGEPAPRQSQQLSIPSPSLPHPSPPSSGRPPVTAQQTIPYSPERRNRNEEDDVEMLPAWLSPAKRVEIHDKEDKEDKEGKGRLADAAGSASSRWLLLNELFPPPEESTLGMRASSSRLHAIPVFVAFSIAGGVGKTALLATLGRALAARGERILLADTAPFSLAPCYFGSQLVPPSPGSQGGQQSGSQAGVEPGLRSGMAPGLLRTFSPPSGSSDAPLDVLLLESGGNAGQRPGEGPESIREALLRNARKASRILVDIQTASKDVAQRLLSLHPLVLTPLLPDLNSVASVAAVEEVFAGYGHAGPAKLIYLLNQFDASSPLHLDVREVLERRLGDRLLPFVLRRSPEMSEALAEGMTVIDYAPDSPAAEDYARLADWLRGVAPPASRGLERFRWSER